MNWALKIALVSVSFLATAAQAHAAGSDNPKSEDNKMQAMQEQIERELFAGMFAMKEFCKQKDPALAQIYDETWNKTAADAPAELKAFAASPEFAVMLAERMKDLSESSKSPAQAAEIAQACAKTIATP